MPREQLPDWRRMAKYLHERVREHPELEGIQTGRGGPVVLHAHERAVYLTCLREVDGGGWQIRAEIERPEW